LAQPWAGGRNPVGIPGTEARDETPKYKASSVEWLGDVPEHCEVKRIKYSASVNDETLAETTEADFEFHSVDIGGVDAVDGIVALEQMACEKAPSRARRLIETW